MSPRPPEKSSRPNGAGRRASNSLAHISASGLTSLSTERQSATNHSPLQPCHPTFSPNLHQVVHSDAGDPPHKSCSRSNAENQISRFNPPDEHPQSITSHEWYWQQSNEKCDSLRRYRAGKRRILQKQKQQLGRRNGGHRDSAAGRHLFKQVGWRRARDGTRLSMAAAAQHVLEAGADGDTELDEAAKRKTPTSAT